MHGRAGRRAGVPRREGGAHLQGVDFAVVPKHAHRLRARPVGESVGGEPGVHERHVGAEVGGAEVVEVGPHLGGRELALVDDGAGGEGGEEDVVVREAELEPHAVLNDLAEHKHLQPDG